jgi:hypothetical protein
MALSMQRFGSVALCAVALMEWLAIDPDPTPVIAAQPTGPSSQSTFASADEATAALLDGMKQGDQRRLLVALGPGSEALINSGDPHADAANRRKFVENYAAQHKLAEVSPGHDILDVGVNDWPLPFPVVQQNERWQFDSRAGAHEIVNRRIGRNEIAAIRVALTYVDAQRDCFDRSKQNGGTGEYTQRLISTPDGHDGLYWPANAGETESPFGPLVAQEMEEGYPGDIVSGRQMSHRGCYFRVLRAQGKNAPGGAKA